MTHNKTIYDYIVVDVEINIFIFISSIYSSIEFQIFEVN